MLSMKRRIAVISAVAVIAAVVPALTVSPATAAPATTAITAVTMPSVNDLAEYKACPASADIPSAGFTDTTDADVDCLAYYGITSGTTATTYSPEDSVSRWQMALFLTRTLSKAGTTLGTGADQGFTDISGLSAEIQTAINQIAQAGITVGKTATTFAPDDNVTRAEMALFIERMNTNISAGPGGTSDAERLTGVATTYINSNCDAATGGECTGKYNYTDIDGGAVTVEAANAIKEIFTLGIHDGVSATTYNPGSDMTRAAMATFLTAALNHSNLRPAGLTIQAASYSGAGAQNPALHVSHRDASHVPVVGTPVDVFTWNPTGLEGDRAFATATGYCEDAVVTTGAITGCYIDVAEPVTDLSGNLTPTGASTSVASQALSLNGSRTYYAWSGAVATTYDNDVHGTGSLYDDITITATPSAAGNQCSMDVPARAASTTHTHHAKWGAVTTITCQLRSVANSSTAGAVASAGTVVSMNRQRVAANVNGVASTAVMEAESVVCLTDAAGTCTFTITGPANPLKAATDNYTDTIVVTAADATIGTVGIAPASGFANFMTDGGTTLTTVLDYRSTTSAVDNVTLTQTSSNALVSATSSTVRSITATAYDQYGDGEAGQTINFESMARMYSGVTCTVANPTVCTLANHGLSAGDIVTSLAKGATFAGDAVVSGTAVADRGTNMAPAAGSQWNVVAVDANTFKLDELGGTNDLEGTAIANAAAPAIMGHSTFARAARTTNSAGQASLSFTDTIRISELDNVCAWFSNTISACVKYYRTATAADFSEVGNNDATAADGETVAACVEFDATNSTYITMQLDGTDVSLGGPVQYVKYAFDSNDQFASTGGAGVLLDGVPITQAQWTTKMATICAVGGAAASQSALIIQGTVSDIAHVDISNGLTTDIVRHTLGVAH